MQEILTDIQKNYYRYSAHFFAFMSMFFMFYVFTKMYLVGAIASLLIAFLKEQIKDAFTISYFSGSNFIASILGAFCAFVLIFVYEFFFKF